MKDKERILNIDITIIPEEGIIKKIVGYIKTGEKKKTIMCANPHSIILAQNDKVIFDSLNNADICLPDGIGVLFASKFMRGKIEKRIAGLDFFISLTDYLNKSEKDIRYFFLGTTDKTLGKIKHKINILYPNIVVAGFYSPPFGEWAIAENSKIINIINSMNTNILWVGIGAPKQEKWTYENIDALNVNIIGCIGAAFDFFAGTKKRSPKFFRKYGLEWLPRLIMEPKRLWKRNFISTPKFIYLIIKAKNVKLIKKMFKTKH